jgi:energy-converting hydrogenase Eha subunit F
MTAITDVGRFIGDSFQRNAKGSKEGKKEQKGINPVIFALFVLFVLFVFLLLPHLFHLQNLTTSPVPTLRLFCVQPLNRESR